MDELWSLFCSVPLPYSYVEFPPLLSPSLPQDKSLYFYVNRVITGLSRAAFRHGGISESSSIRKWNFSWGRQFEADVYAVCESWQKVNHFAGAFLMGRKDELHERMRELSDRLGHVPFYPESYLLPKDKRQFQAAFPAHPFWICKPSAAARGSGIRIVASTAKIPTVSQIYQVYIERPFLITERKFDLRLYVLVTSISPVRIYIHENGMARFAVRKYSYDLNPSDLKANLTNYSLNKDDEGFVFAKGRAENVNNSKWSLAFFMDILRKAGIDTSQLLTAIEKVTISTVIAGICAIRKHHRKYIKHRHTSYELYGIDILLDQDLRPFVMEINISPGMDGSDSVLDKRLKQPLMRETLNMARFIRCNCEHPNPCPGVDLVDQLWRTSNGPTRQAAVMEDGEDPWKNPTFGDFVSIRDFLEERNIREGFRLVYPKRSTMAQFEKCFDVVEYSDVVFQRWVAKPPRERFDAIKRHFHEFRSEIQTISARVAAGAAPIPPPGA
jgi:tubulin polyglutamylase TTLL4